MPKLNFVESPVTKKKNPNSLRRLFVDILNYKFDGNLTRAADEIKRRYAIRYGIQGRSPRTFRRHLGEIVADSRRIEYWDIEVFANIMGVTSGQLLLFSRLRSDSGDHLTCSVIENGTSLGLKRIVLRLAEGEPLDVELLDEWSDLMSELQPGLPIP